MRAAEALANGMKRLRRRLGLTQAELAEAAGLHVQYISQAERQKRSPSLETIDAIAAGLDVTAAELLAEGEGENPSPSAPRDQVERLLASWPESDWPKLVRLLVGLRQMAMRANPKRSR